MAAMAGGIVFAVDFAKTRQTVVATCPNELCDRRVHTEASVQTLNDRWNRDVVLVTTLGAVGIAGTTTTIIQLVSARARSSQLGMAPFVSPGIGGVVAHGAF